MEYLKQAAVIKPGNVSLNIEELGVVVEAVWPECQSSPLVSWIEIEQCRVNPIILAIECVLIGAP